MTKAILALVLILGLFAVTAVPAQAQTIPGVPIPVSAGGQGATFTGTFFLQNFTTNAAGQILANGVLTGTLSRGANVLGTILQNVSLPVGSQLLPGTGGACSILHLELGPIDLNLLGLRLQTNKIVIDLTAIPGGGLLGDLLSGLLCSNPLGQITSGLLNQVLGILRTLQA